PQYFILAIITRGAIDDLREAIQAIIFASRSPLSIIFIGVGENNFIELERLGFSGARLSYHGRRADRDLLQFVSVSKFRSKEQSDEEAKDSLVEKAVYQIPWQMASWMMKNGYIASANNSDEQNAAGGSGRTPRGVMPTQQYDSLISSYSSSSEQIDADTPTTSECTS
uniref:Copine C-terminal domain-containing protein n=1 Tax=Parascaris univalens TaxID=6257 RepID=A0A915BFQ0_PARUN